MSLAVKMASVADAALNHSLTHCPFVIGGRERLGPIR